MQVIQNVYRVSETFVNQYFIVDSDGITLIDTGMRGNGKKILRAIEEIGENPSRLSRILITHADADHFGAVNELIKITGAQVFASRVEAEAIRIGKSSRPLKAKGIQKILFGMTSALFQAQPANVDKLLVAGQVLPISGGLKVVNSIGHTPGHISFFLPSLQVLFAGDSIRVRGGHPAPSIGANTWDLEKARQSFEIQEALSPRFYCCGHGFFRVDGD